MDVTPGAGGATRGSIWFPLILFGAVSLAASPLYAGVPSGTADLFHLSDYRPDPLSENPAAIALFWLVASPLGYLATFVFYRYRAHRRHGVFSARSYLMTGLVLFVLMVANFLAERTPLSNLSDLYIRALTPLFVIAIGLFVLARWQRSLALAIFAIGFLGLVGVANLYDLAGLTDRIGINADSRTNIVIVGATLVLAGIAFGISQLTTRRRTA